MANTHQTTLEEIIVSFCESRVAAVGDSFATEKELETIKDDPMGWLELLRGYDAFEVLRESKALRNY